MTSTILAIDITSEFGSIALLSEDALVAERQAHSSDGFGHILFNEIDALLKQAGISIVDVNYFAAAAGPGSFTGVRVGLTAAKGLAESLSKPVMTVSNLRALAWHGNTERRAVLLDARRGEIYGAVYDQHLELKQPEVVTPFQKWVDGLPGENVEFISLAGSPLLDILAGTRFSTSPRVHAPRALAAAIAHCAALDVKHGRIGDPLNADANYVRRSDAELFWKEA